MTGKDKSRIHAIVGALPLLVFLGLTLAFSQGCAQGGSSSAGLETAPTVPSVKTERELLLEIDKKFENPEAHYELARYYHTGGQWTKAEYHYDRALGFRPGLAAAQAGLVKLYVDHGQPAKAEQFANGYIGQASRNTRTTLRLAWEFENLGLSEYAMRCFRQALAGAPDSYEANRQMGLYYLGKGQDDQARRYLARSFELNPRQPEVAGALGRLGVVVESPEPEPKPEGQEREAQR
ncbi:MAG: hypothetical protein JW993_16315 [Sedimentisphaerales bacterium]|nr:hypothetical protein [Sedimentisphaerales bacterium]